MKTLYRTLIAALWTLCLSLTALADLLPYPEPEPEKTSPLVPILIIAAVVIAATVIAVLIRSRKR